MYIYSFSQGNPEGIDYCYTLCHKEKFSNEEFQEICEQVIVDTLEKMTKKRKVVFLSSIDTCILFSILESRGFRSIELQAQYDLEPYGGRDRIQNPELLKWATGQKKKDIVDVTEG